MEQTAQLPGTDTKNRASGRKSADGQEQPLKLTTLKQDAPKLMKLYNKLQDAAQEFSDAVKASAKRSNANASVIKKLVRDSYSGNFEESARAVYQQAEIFEEVGEIPGGRSTEDAS